MCALTEAAGAAERLTVVCPRIRKQRRGEQEDTEEGHQLRWRASGSRNFPRHMGAQAYRAHVVPVSLHRE